MHNDGIAYATSGTWITSPIWLEYFDPAYQLIVATMGFALLVLTIRNKWLDAKIKRATLDEIAATTNETKKTVTPDGKA